MDGDWTPIHDFCEANQLPCVLPQALAPPDRGASGGFYSLYFSRGLPLETAALLKHLELSSGTGRRKVLQVARCGSPGAAAAREVEAALGGSVSLATRCVTAAPTADEWRTMLGPGPDVVVPWLEAYELAGLEAVAASGEWRRTPTVYLSASLIADNVSAVARGLRAAAYLLEPYVAPDEFERHAARTLTWMKARGLDGVDRIAATNTLFAVTALADAVSMPRVLASREYAVEQIEHMVGRSPHPTAFPAVGLGALRRFASVGCSVVKMSAEPGGAFEKSMPWFVPDRAASR